MKVSDYLKRLETLGSDMIVLPDLVDGVYNNKSYTIGTDESGAKHTFVTGNFKESLEQGIATIKDDKVSIPRDKTAYFESTGLTHIQVTAVKPWSVDQVKIRD